MESNERRRFLQSVTILGAAGVSRASEAVAPEHPAHAHGVARDVYRWFTPAEAAFVEAAVARLIPADDLGPGAKEAGVATFIDQQLSSAWGVRAHSYRQGPWLEGTPSQGEQSALAPVDVYRSGIAEMDRTCTARFGKVFEALAAAQQDEVLHDLQAGRTALESVPARLFFGMLWSNTQEGFFSDPMYGGNRDKIGWKLVGFPGVAAAYTDLVEKHGVPYHVEPVSIADVELGHTAVDAHGHPVHVPRATRG